VVVGVGIYMHVNVNCWMGVDVDVNMAAYLCIYGWLYEYVCKC